LKKLLSIALVLLFTIATATLYACKGAGCGFNKNTSAQAERINKSQCGFGVKSTNSSASARVQESPYVEANIISVSNDGVKQFRCPVSGTENSLVANTKFIDYESKRYYVDCSGSEAKFIANPAKYVLAMQNDINSEKVSNRGKAKSCCPSGVGNAKNTKIGKSS
jgi:hypothetical protein